MKPFQSQEQVKMPLQWRGNPCSSVTSTNVGRYAVPFIAGLPFVTMWFYPDGVMSTNDPENRANAKIQINTVVTSAVVGPNHNRVLVGGVVGSANAGLIHWDSGYVDPFVEQGTAVDNNWAFLPYDTKDDPFFFTANASIPIQEQVTCRTIAFGVRVTYTGALQNTEGWVEFINPYEWPTALAGANVPFSGYRRDPSYRRVYFSKERTAEFIWRPNCEGPKFLGAYSMVAGVNNTQGCRFCIKSGAMVSGDSYQVEWISHVEYINPHSQSIMSLSPQSHDAAHIGNAIVTSHISNSHLAVEVEAHKHLAEPHSSSLLSAGEAALAGAGGIGVARSLVTRAMPYLARAGSAIVGGVESAAPMLATLL
jgi:hypothetical protein